MRKGALVGNLGTAKRDEVVTGASGSVVVGKREGRGGNERPWLVLGRLKIKSMGK